MKIDHCDHCGQLVFFENCECLSCRRALAFFPDTMEIGSLEPAELGLRRRRMANDRVYRLCANYSGHNVCNWVVPATEPDALCASCRLTRVIPDLNRPGAREAWYRLETAKRRLIYSLLALKLPVLTKNADAERGLAFEFLAEPSVPGAAPVRTGHGRGVITISVAEADDVEREKRRVALGEPYRTLLGHFRHEIGHYYWDRLISNGPRLQAFRQLFGDERADYGQALQWHYRQGPPPDWNERHISGYASSHPWEDWAETWAHYLHMNDTLEIATNCGLSLRPKHPDEPTLKPPAAHQADSFTALIDAWFPLTYLLNNLNRGLGLADGYPFVLSTPVIDKLRFVHATIASPP